MVLKEALVFARYLRATDPEDVASIVADIIDKQALAGIFAPTDEATVMARVKQRVRSVVGNTRRGEKRREAGYEALALASEVKDTSGPIEMRPDKFVIVRDCAEAAYAAVRKMPKETRTVLELRWSDEWDIEDIATYCRISQRKVQRILARALPLLATVLHAHAPEGLQ